MFISQQCWYVGNFQCLSSFHHNLHMGWLGFAWHMKKALGTSLQFGIKLQSLYFYWNPLFHNCKFTSKVEKNPALKRILDALFPGVFLWKEAPRVMWYRGPMMSSEVEPGSEASCLRLNFEEISGRTAHRPNIYKITTEACVFELLFSCQKTQSHNWLCTKSSFSLLCPPEAYSPP